MVDAELVEHALAGDSGAIAAIYDRYADRIHDYARSMLRNAADAADVTQDTFLVGAERLGQLRDPAKLRPWLYAIARSHALRVIRLRERVESNDELDEAVEMTTPEGAIDAQRLVRAAADGLEDGDRDILDLHLRHGLEGQELADALGVTANAANVALHRVRERFEQAATAVLLARTSKGECGDLDRLVGEGLSPLVRKRVNRHVSSCKVCERRKQITRPFALFAALPLAGAPPALRDQVLAQVGTTSAAEAAGQLRWRGDGFPESSGALVPAHVDRELGVASEPDKVVTDELPEVATGADAHAGERAGEPNPGVQRGFGVSRVALVAVAVALAAFLAVMLWGFGGEADIDVATSVAPTVASPLPLPQFQPTTNEPAPTVAAPSPPPSPTPVRSAPAAPTEPADSTAAPESESAPLPPPLATATPVPSPTATVAPTNIPTPAPSPTPAPTPVPTPSPTPGPTPAPTTGPGIPTGPQAPTGPLAPDAKPVITLVSFQCANPMLVTVDITAGATITGRFEWTAGGFSGGVDLVAVAPAGRFSASLERPTGNVTPHVEATSGGQSSTLVLDDCAIFA